MEHCPRWLGADHLGASPAFGELAQSWPHFSRPSTKVEPSPVVRWRRPLQSRASAPPEVVVEAAKNRVDGIEATLGALAAVGTTSPRPDQPDGVVPRKGKEEVTAYDAARTSSRAKVVSNVSEQLQPQQMLFPDRALQQTWRPRCKDSSRW